MTDIADNIRQIVDGPTAPALVQKYYREGLYTGAKFDSAELAPTDPHRLEMVDLVSPATLSAELSGKSVAELLPLRSRIDQLLSELPDTSLLEADDDDLEPLWSLQRLLGSITGIGPVRLSKILAHKRPNLVPIRDQYVLAAMGLNHNSELTLPLRDALRSNRDILGRLESLADSDGVPDISLLRTLDVVLWMHQHGDAQVQNAEHDKST